MQIKSYLATGQLTNRRSDASQGPEKTAGLPPATFHRSRTAVKLRPEPLFAAFRAYPTSPARSSTIFPLVLCRVSGPPCLSFAIKRSSSAYGDAGHDDACTADHSRRGRSSGHSFRRPRPIPDHLSPLIGEGLRRQTSQHVDGGYYDLPPFAVRLHPLWGPLGLAKGL